MLIILPIIVLLSLIVMVILLVETFILVVSRNKTRQGLTYLAAAITCGLLAAVATLSILSTTSLNS